MASFPITSPIAINHSENRTSSLTSSPRSSVPRPELSRINTPNLILTITSLSEQQRQSSTILNSYHSSTSSDLLAAPTTEARGCTAVAPPLVRIRSWNSSS
uniref:Uncharacterized protein n=1 Tax=Cucumis melo TaxID=3656 RepID=A0A9I9D6U0_CUCME